MARWTIYRAWPAGRDERVGEVDAETAVAALERFAEHVEIRDYSIDHGSAGRLILCPYMMRQHYYVYASEQHLIAPVMRGIARLRAD